MISKAVWVFSALMFTGFISPGQSKVKTEKIIRFSADKLPEAVSSLEEYLAIPNNSREEEQLKNNLEWIANKLKSLGFRIEEIKTGGFPLLLAEKKVKDGLPTALIYMQADGQPVDSSRWHQESPYIPVIKEKKGDEWVPTTGNIESNWRLFGRSASDSKGPSIAFLSALEILEEKHLQPGFNIKVVVDFEEELGSPLLPATIRKNRKVFQADFLLIMDGARHVSGLPTLCYGARGIATAKIIIYGPAIALHSGQYGNYAPNPVFAATRLIAGMKDEQGIVLLPGFYEGVKLSETDKKILSATPVDEEALKSRLGIKKPESVGGSYEESLQYPSLNVRGMRAAWVDDEVRTIIPDKVTIEIDMRLVPETPGQRQIDLLKKYIMEQGYQLVDGEPSNTDRAAYEHLASFSYRLGSVPFRTDLDNPFAISLKGAMQRIFGENFVNMRTTGGSQPIGAFINTLNIPAVSVRFPNADNNIHGPDENLEIGCFLDGIEACLSILLTKFNK